jgi:dihydropteroate synthase
MSSRPGAEIINDKEEWSRLEPVLSAILKDFSDKHFSIDTLRASIAERSVSDYGLSIINDISGGKFDKKMFETVAKCNVPYIIMHMIGTPENMQQNVNYDSIIDDIILYFSDKIQTLKSLGVNDVIIDPGFGFSKTIEQNYFLLNKLEKFKIFELPILAGLSRKSMIWKQLNLKPETALNGTSVLNTIALNNGANILRVHDVVEAKQCVELYHKTQSSI